MEGGAILGCYLLQWLNGAGYPVNEVGYPQCSYYDHQSREGGWRWRSAYGVGMPIRGSVNATPYC